MIGDMCGLLLAAKQWVIAGTSNSFTNVYYFLCFDI